MTLAAVYGAAAAVLAGWLILFLRLVAADRAADDPWRYHDPDVLVVAFMRIRVTGLKAITAAMLELRDAFVLAAPAIRRALEMRR